MADIALRAEGLGKQYRLGVKRERYQTFRDTLTNLTASPFRQAGRLLRGQAAEATGTEETVWALRDISFEIKHGEVVGVIGRNGAGKSTLLKILSRITEPTVGQAEIHGRVGSLLEVGTGFHPELTGRENIFLNGAILGMKKTDIERRFDEIVAFAEVEKFIDTPVKHYSSGMYLRLAFAVAAHLEPDILVVDEVLAVGDAAFQKKCLGKMGDVARGGRTVLFVSHQLSMINVLCERALLLADGQIIQSGPATQVVDYYARFLSESAGAAATITFPEKSALKAQLLNASIRRVGDEPAGSYDVFEPIELQVQYLVREPLHSTAVNLIAKRNGETLFVSFDTDNQPALLGIRNPGVYTTSVRLPTPLKAGHYLITLSLSQLNGSSIDLQEEALTFEVEERSFDSSMRAYSSKRAGIMAAHLQWNTNPLSTAPSDWKASDT